jgi:hypothetical protein
MNDFGPFVEGGKAKSLSNPKLVGMTPSDPEPTPPAKPKPVLPPGPRTVRPAPKASVENPMNSALAKTLMAMAFPSTPVQSPDPIRTSLPPEEFDLTPRLPEVTELPEPSDPFSPGEGDLPPRCLENCKKLREELREEEEEESRRRLAEAGAQFA